MRGLARGGPMGHRKAMSERKLEKAALRAEALARRAALGPEARADAATRAAGFALAALGPGAGPVAVFLPIRDEIDTAPLIAALIARGERVCLPVVRGRGVPLLFRAWAPGEALETRGFGLSEPPEFAPEVVPGRLVVPLAAFDRRGHRIGYGAGHYDRTLASLGRTRAIGFAFSVQEVARVPEGRHDVALDAVATEAGLVSPSS
jgi:5-formyltetrahydrofolate cyclo-ligase